MKYGLILTVFLFGCEFFKPKEIKTEEPIARAIDQMLYPSDLVGLFPDNISVQDSAKLAEKYVLNWVKKQLLISRSSNEIDFNEAEIERKVLDYRYALMVHAFEKKYINAHLNLEVGADDINQYYSEKSDNFLLKQNIIKCIFAQVPKNAPNINQFSRNFKSHPDSNPEDLKSYVTQFALKSYLEDTTWIVFEEVVTGTPLENVQNKTQFLEQNKYSETSDNDYTYFLKIFDYKISNEISPLEFIRDDIQTIIINKRKIALKKELEEKIYEEARERNLFKIYTD